MNTIKVQLLRLLIEIWVRGSLQGQKILKDSLIINAHPRMGDYSQKLVLGSKSRAQEKTNSHVGNKPECFIKSNILRWHIATPREAHRLFLNQNREISGRKV